MSGEEVEPVVVDAGSGRRLDSEAHVFSAGPNTSDGTRARYAVCPAPPLSRRSLWHDGAARTSGAGPLVGFCSAQLRANSSRSALKISANLGTIASPCGAPG